jgi:cytochrome c oxidase assembly protein subunit 15
VATLAETTITSSANSAQRLRPVRAWLYVMAALVLLMVVVGGITRLTESGLSITSWKPISGTIPPLSDADWQVEFDAYKAIPQYQVLNQWMTVNDFKAIFWWEWSHRFLGRFLGVAFAVPFVIFLFQRRLSRDLAAPLAGLFVMGGFQGVLGWWMVSSGLSELTSVSQYRLAAHLTAAALLFISLLYVARSLKPNKPLVSAPANTRIAAYVLLALVIVQIGAGAFVAGLDAGMGYNTWPLMDGAIIPTGLGSMDPLWRNFFDNTLTVQFIHRCIAYAITIYVAVLVWRQARAGGFAAHQAWLPRIGAAVLLQVCLGIGTLLMMVPIDLAVAHQAMAFLLVGTVTLYLADLHRGKPGRA